MKNVLKQTRANVTFASVGSDARIELMEGGMILLKLFKNGKKTVTATIEMKVASSLSVLLLAMSQKALDKDDLAMLYEAGFYRNLWAKEWDKECLKCDK